MSQSALLRLGEVADLSVLCISETGWFDSRQLLDDIAAAGGMKASQYSYGWPPYGTLHADNRGGSAALIEFRDLDGHPHRILLDSGWSEEWMQSRFQAEGIDRLLADGEIDCLVVSHEHFDHFWGIGVALQYRPDMTIYVNSGFFPEGYEHLKRAGHTGELVVVQPDQPVLLFPGVALVNFDQPFICRIQGENVLYFNLKDKGICTVTGCGHPGIVNILEYARQRFVGGEQIYAVYGGLHIAPFEQWKPELDELVDTLAEYNIPVWACNHCTGAITVQKMIEAGMSVVRGSARNGSRNDFYLGNGDRITF
jgi:7,8-dihydropterin-6-yl-methyl-4-(beta-D-ribofuranosyl)aminobenzene 5'-phosphate synthase